MKGIIRRSLSTLLTVVIMLTIVPHSLLEAKALTTFESVQYYETTKDNVSIRSTANASPFNEKSKIATKGTVLKIKGYEYNYANNLWYQTVDNTWVFSGNVKQHKHDYNYDVCKSKGCGYIWPCDVKSIDAARFVVIKNAVLRSKPYSDPKAQAGTVAAGTVLEINAYTRNRLNNTWFRTTSGKWIYQDNIREYSVIEQRRDAWFASALGRGMDPDKQYGYQCFDVAVDYNNYLYAPDPLCGQTIKAKDIYPLANEKNYEKIKYESGRIPQYGDIIVFSWSYYGHVAVVKTANSDKIVVYEQNGGQNWLPCRESTYNYSNDITGWLRPKINGNGGSYSQSGYYYEPEPIKIPPARVKINLIQWLRNIPFGVGAMSNASNTFGIAANNAVVNSNGMVEIDTRDIGKGDTVNIKWGAVDNADYYTISINGVEKAERITTTQHALTLSEAGSYSIRVRAHNDVGSGEWSEEATVTVHPDVNVTFFVESVYYQKLTLTWGRSISIMPEIPTRKGSTFTGWFEQGVMVSASFNEIKRDMSVHAKYVKLKYTVNFKDKDGNQIEAPQIVEDGDAAIEPIDRSFVPEGYHFVGWDKAFNRVKENLTITAVLDLNDYSLPVQLTNVSATRYTYGYTVYCTVNNLALGDTTGRVIVALKTQEGKLITTTESAAYFVKGQENEVLKIVTPNLHDNRAQNLTAVKAEVFAVRKFQTTVPVSPMVSVSIADQDPWSDWSLNRRVNSPFEEQQKTEYRYRDEQKTTSSNPSMPGWTLWNTTFVWSAYGSWSALSPTEPQATDYRQVEPVKVIDRYGYSEYQYYRFTNGYWIHFCPEQGRRYHGGSWYTQYSGWTTTDIAAGWLGQTHEWVSGTCPHCGMQTSQGATVYNFGGKDYYHKSSRWIPEISHTEWKYRDRTKIFTYHFNRWSGWSAWSTVPVTPTTTREVDTQALYRYKENVLERVEDATGVFRTVSGNIGSEFAGKQAVLTIYKVNEASDWTIEYIGQAAIGSDGSYTFDSFKLREEPSVATGDFTVVLGIQGSNVSMYLDTIAAPLPEYEVNFIDHDGTVLSSQIVFEGGSATPPPSPSREGYSFVGWDTRSTNIGQNINIYAQYRVNEYVVVFIDWHNHTYDINTYHHGDLLSVPAMSDTEDMRALGWDKVLEGIDTVTSNMVLTAHYETKTFAVNFYDYDMNIINTQIIEYGQMPEEFVLPEDEQYDFFGWKNGATQDFVDIHYYPVTQNLDLHPQYVYTETVSPPQASVSGGVFNAEITIDLSCTTPTALIFYTLDGSDPTTETGILYTDPITIARSTKLRYYACALNMNSSAVYTELYAVNLPGKLSNWMIFENLPDAVRNNGALYGLESCLAYSYKELIVAQSIEEAIYLQSQGWLMDETDPEMLTVFSWTAFETEPPETGETREFAEETVYRFLLPLDYIFRLFLGETNEPVYEGFVNAGQKFSNELIPTFEGSTFEGLYNDVEFTQPWNIDSDTFNESTSLYLRFSVNLHTVEFLDYDGFVLGSQQVEYNSYATPPEDPEREGYVFVGWDTDAFQCVRNDMIVNAAYISEAEYVRVILDRTLYNLIAGTSFRLNATINPEDASNKKVSWYSSDTTVARVDQDGNVTAVAFGFAVISAYSDANGSRAMCSITVSPNPADTICFAMGSSLYILDDGFLCGIKATANTVAEIRPMFANSHLEFHHVSDRLLEAEERIGTGTVVKLRNGNNTLDQITVMVIGDANGDGEINNRDAAMATRYLVGKETITAVQMAALDVNGDGVVNNRDASMIARYLVGKEVI